MTTNPKTVYTNLTHENPMVFLNVGETAKSINCTLRQIEPSKVDKRSRSITVYGAYHSFYDVFAYFCLFHSEK